MSDILIVEGDGGTAKILRTMLKTEGYSVALAASTEEAGEQISAKEFRLVIVDAVDAMEQSITFIDTIRQTKPTAVILLVGEGQEPDDEVRSKVFEVMEKPLRMDDLLGMVQRAIDYSDTAINEMKDLSVDLETSYQFDDIIAESPAMRSVCSMISRVAATDVAVMVQGEKGSGRGLVAKAIMNHSSRKDKGFVEVDCCHSDGEAVEKQLFGAGTDAGALEASGGGTVFLRDVQSLAHGAQLKLSKALQGKEVTRDNGKTSGFDARILVSATSDLPEFVDSGRFRQDLHKVLKAIVIKVPLLRDHAEDIRPLASRFLRSETPGGQGVPVIDDHAMKAMEAYSWPGNVAELRDMVKDAVAGSGGGEIGLDQLPDAVRQAVGG